MIRGSDVVKGWTNDGGDVWSVPWQPLPLIDYPDGWPDVDEYARRREMVFIDGNPLEQVLSRAELVSGHFWMDDAAQRIRIHYSGDPNISQVEISVRTQGVMARGKSYLVFRGLRVEHVSTDIWIGAMALGSHRRVEDCRVEYNNGVGIEACSDSVIMRTTSNHNGAAGNRPVRKQLPVGFQRNQLQLLAIRARIGAGGIKVVGDVRPPVTESYDIPPSTTTGPESAFDTVGSGNVVEASLFEGNIIAASQFEATIGPNWAINNVIVGTVKANSRSVRVDGVGIIMMAPVTPTSTTTQSSTSAEPGLRFRGSERDDGQFYPANTQVFNNIIVDPGLSAIRFKVWGDGCYRRTARISPIRQQPLFRRRSDHNFQRVREPLVTR